MLSLGVDLGGTNIKVALVDAAGTLIAENHRPTGLPCAAEQICDTIVALSKELLNENVARAEEVCGIGIGCPGTIDDRAGVVLYSNNLGWHDFAMKAYIAERLGMPAVLINDANAAAYGEAAVGCAKGAESAVILTLGTGVGGGVILNGKLLTGYTGAAAEPGHMVIVDRPDAPLCTCGRRGCLEAYASATALIERTKQSMAQHPDSKMHRLCPDGTVTGHTAFDAAAQGDAAAQSVVDVYVHFLAVGVANLVNLFFPEVIGFSGGVANQGENLLVPLRKEVDALTFGHAQAKKKTKLVACTLGYHAGLIGAALLANTQACPKGREAGKSNDRTG